MNMSMCDKGLTGLANIGNTCYLNSCIQILSNTHILSEVLDQYEEGGETKPDALLLLEWNSLRRLMWSKNCVIAPHRFVTAVQKVAKLKSRNCFISFDQNDTHEFWMFLIECLHSSLARKVDMEVRGRALNQADKLAKACYKKIKEMFNDDYSEMIDMFYGMEVTSIRRQNEEREMLSFMPEPFSVISLPIPSKRRVTLYDCLDVYCADEEMNGENAWFNEETNKKEDVLRGVKFWSLPKVLVINLNRWNLYGHKVHTNVDVPLDDLDLSRYVDGYDLDNNLYSLYGVCNHMGGSGGGHYTAHVRNANGKWYEYNDTKVIKLQQNRVISGNSYCLFFKRV
jgi:ubiquitin C-terminal hydrolase